MFNIFITMILLNLLFLNLGGSEVMLILVVILLFFGSKNIPDLARGLGKGMREFREASDGIKREIEKLYDDKTINEQLQNLFKFGKLKSSYYDGVDSLEHH